MSIREFLKECNDRDVFKRVSIYIVSSWVILQVLVAIWSPLGIPEISVTYLIIALLIGFPVYVYYLWKTKSHLILTDPDDMQEEADVLRIKRKHFKTMYFRSLVVISVLSFLTAGWIVNNNFIDNKILPDLNSGRIAVLNFDNDTGDNELDIVGKMTADWLIHGITENIPGEVISSQVIDNYSNLLTAQVGPSSLENSLSSFFKTEKVVKGAYFLRGDKLVFQCLIQDGSNSKNIIGLEPVECPKEDALECIDELKQRVIAFFTMTDEGSLGIEDNPPKFEAYQKRLLAREAYDDRPKYIGLLNEAIAIDSNYFEPQILRVQFYYNQRDFKTADSLFKSLSFDKQLGKRQKALLNFNEGIIEGKNDKAWRNFKYEYDIVPKELETNSTYMTLSLQFVNKPELLESSFNEIPMNDFNLEDCIQCAFRFYTMGLAYNELGEFEKTIELLEPVVDVFEFVYLYRTLLTAYAELNNDQRIAEMLDAMELTDRIEDMYHLSLHAARTFLLNGQNEKAIPYLQSVAGHEDARIDHRAEAYYFLGDYENSEKAYQKLYSQDDSQINMSMLAISLHKNGKDDEAESIIVDLRNTPADFNYGEIEYALARYYSALNRTDDALRELQKSVLKGKKYYPTTFQNDPHLIDCFESPVFNTIMTAWH